jgi:chemotaxis protein MotA
MANMICIPITSKLKNNTAAEEMRRKMIITGILAIQNGDNPGIVRQKLLPFLAPNERSQVTGD